MARQVYETQPWRKHLETYQDFSGGLNVTDTNEKLSDAELTILTNAEMGERGSIQRRTGFTQYLEAPLDVDVQGFFRYSAEDGTITELLAQSGKLYKNNSGTWEMLTITDLDTFQTTKPIEAIQLKDKLVIATGTKLVEFDGTTAKVVAPHKPDSMEALYVGTNGLHPNPDDWTDHGVGTFLSIDLVQVTPQKGVFNEDITIRVTTTRPDLEEVQYKYERIWPGRTEYYLSQDWTTSRFHVFKTERDDQEIKVTARLTSNPTDEVEYIIPSYKSYGTDKNNKESSSEIHSCTRIILHWGRLFLYGGADESLVYISQLNQHDYFPTLNTIRFESDLIEGVTDIIQYRDMLLVFTPSTIQALYGKSPEDYSRTILNSTIGCVSPRTAKVVQNHVFFHSAEGIFKLKSAGLSNDRANVEKMDMRISSLVPTEAGCAISHDNQYMIFFPQEKKCFRFYHEYESWVMDESDMLDIVSVRSVNGELYAVRQKGDILKKSYTSYKDVDSVYELKLETKYYTFGQPYHQKKLKEIMLVLGHFKTDVNANLFVYADSHIAVNPSESKAVVNEEGYVEWQVESNPNLVAKSGTTFGSWELGESSFGEVDADVHELKVSGKCRKTKVVITHNEDTPFRLLGLSYVFKIKKL